MAEKRYISLKNGYGIMCFVENIDFDGKSGFTYASEFNRRYRIGFTAASAIS
ncbi:MAG: hypothetical protein IJ099_01365 [Alphaproteobacteria bacterium]|nr:hypothetical protein [Alphaproteobacteria bacterium]